MWHPLSRAPAPEHARMLLCMQAETFALPGSGRSGVGSAPAVQGQRLVMRDNVHLFDPGAEHHEVLATEGTGATSPGNPFFPLSASCWPDGSLPACTIPLQ